MRRRAAELMPWLADADVLLDLHSMHEPGSPLLLTGPLSRHVSLVRELALSGHVVVDAGHADGVRLRNYGRYGDPAGSARTLLIVLDRAGARVARGFVEEKPLARMCAD